MNLDSIRAYCLSFPHAAEKIQWENHLLFTIGGKMFLITSLEPSPFVATLKPDPEHRFELLEMEGIEPAPYMARAGWVSIRRWDTLRDPEWRDLIAESYRMIFGKLTKKLQTSLSGDTPSKAPAKRIASATATSPKKRAAAARAKSPAGTRARASTTSKKAGTKRVQTSDSRARKS